MNKRVAFVAAIVACVLLAALAIGVAACGSGSAATTTTAAPTTTSAAPTTTSAAGTATTAAGSVTVPSVPMTADVQAYIQQMQTWSTALSAIPSTGDPLQIASVSAVTPEQITAAETIATQAHAALDQLKAIKPPAAFAAFQQSLVTLISGAFDATNKAIKALNDKDQTALDAARAQGDALEAQMNTLFQSLMPLLSGGTPTS